MFIITNLQYIKNYCNFTHMRKRFYIYIAFVCLIILVAFKKPVKTDPFRKFKILSEVIRHAQEAYFKDLFKVMLMKSLC